MKICDNVNGVARHDGPTENYYLNRQLCLSLTELYSEFQLTV